MPMTTKEIISRVDKLKGKRGNWETLWQEAYDYILPRKNEVQTRMFPGDKRNRHLFDNTAIQSNELLAGSLHGMLTSPNRIFFGLTTGNQALDRDDSVRTYFQEASQAIFNELQQSNFQTEVHEFYLDLTSIGTAAMSIEEDDDGELFFSTKHISDYMVDENHKGFVDRIYREFKMELGEIKLQFGSKALEQDSGTKTKFANKSNDDEFTVVHAVYPMRQDKDQEGPDLDKWESVYILKDEEITLRKSKFNEFPFVVSRWTKSSGEMYGRSPGMNALPEAKTVNEMARTTIRGAQKTVDPPVEVPDDGFVLPINQRPGGVNYKRAGSQDQIRPIFNDARIDFGFEAMREKQNKIREAFFVDQLQLGQGPQMTATEVNQRTEEKMRLLAPMLGRQNNEFLKPLIDRVFNIMERNNKLPEPPAILRERNVGVEYLSVVAISQRLVEGQNIMRGLSAMAGFFEVDPTATDVIKPDAGVRRIAEIYGWTQDMINSENDVETIRQQRQEAARVAAEQQQEDQTVQQTNQIAQAENQIAQAQRARRTT